MANGLLPSGCCWSKLVFLTAEFCIPGGGDEISPERVETGGGKNDEF
jgi:hypothetical protein